MASPMIVFSSVSHGTIRLDGSVCSANTLQSHWLRRSKFIYGLLTLTFQYCLPITIVSYAYTRIYLQIRKRHLSRATLRLNEMLSELASCRVPGPGKPAAIERNYPPSQINGDMQISVGTNMTSQPKPACKQVENETEIDLQDACITRKSTNSTMFSPAPVNQNQIPDREKIIRRRHVKTNALLAAVTITFILAWLPLHTFNLVMDLRELEVASDITALMGVDLDPSLINQSPLPVSTNTSDTVSHFPNKSNLASNSDLQKPVMTGRIFTLIQSFCLFCVLLSACINPVLYGWLNENFHREFKLVCSPCRASMCPCLESRTNDERARTMNENTILINSPN